MAEHHGKEPARPKVVSCRIVRGPFWTVAPRMAAIAALGMLGTLALLRGPVPLLGTLFPVVASVLMRAKLVIEPRGLALRWLFLRRLFPGDGAQIAIRAASRVRNADVRVLANGEDWRLSVRKADLETVLAGLPEGAVTRTETPRMVPDVVALTVMLLAALCALYAVRYCIGHR